MGEAAGLEHVTGREAPTLETAYAGRKAIDVPMGAMRRGLVARGKDIAQTGEIHDVTARRLWGLRDGATHQKYKGAGS